MIRTVLGFCAVALAFLPVAASAHLGVGDTHGFLHGFSHPLSGIGHTLAMIAVGMFAARSNEQRARSAWTLQMAAEPVERRLVLIFDTESLCPF